MGGARASASRRRNPPIRDVSDAVVMARRRRDDVTSEGAESGDQLLHKPQQRHAANARERSRMRVLSKAFSRLKVS